jgi:hypothetical protein
VVTENRVESFAKHKFCYQASSVSPLHAIACLEK